MRKKQVLIADDDQAFLMGLAIRLRKHDFGVITADSGYDALRKALTYRPDVIITDINMPLGDGFALRARLGNLSWDPPPVIYVTGEKSGRMEARLWLSNACEVLYKPLDVAELLRTIEDMLIAA